MSTYKEKIDFRCELSDMGYACKDINTEHTFVIAYESTGITVTKKSCEGEQVMSFTDEAWAKLTELIGQ